MCGIISILSNTNDCIDYLLDGLKQLQNRGYDSAGICTIDEDNDLKTQKYASNEKESAIIKLEKNKNYFLKSKIGIGHTRWATHGSKSDINSHPFVSSDHKFVIVHNGIIENYNVLKKMLINEGYTFTSETDSEVICNLLSYHYKQVKEEENGTVMSIYNTIQKLEGTWGLCILCTDTPNVLYCTRNGSPILVGKEKDYVIVSSEQSGFCKNIENYIVLNNFDICVIKKINENISIETDHKYHFKKITNTDNSLTPEPYLHWTLKEIYENAESSLRAISFGGRLLPSLNTVKLGGLDSKREILSQIENLILLGCGTSYHSGICGLHYFKNLCNFNCVQLFDGADFSIKDVPKKGKTGLILLSQSGETKDLYRCLQIAKDNNLFTIGVINVVDSLIAREVDCGCYLNAGREIAVASTKSFISQCIVLSMIAIWFSQIHNVNTKLRKEYLIDLTKLHLQIKDTLNDLENKVEPFLHLFNEKDHCFILGKGISEAIAHEGSLKIKEISYIHSEGYSTSSLKHGPFALLCKDFPVILIAPDDEFSIKNENAYHEIESRNANILLITDKKEIEYAENRITIPYNKTYSHILSVLVLQMLAYKLSIARAINPDMPKNLAKVVTVE
jgi:glucosamine--fructose-6-phosphate aminotransferase (isomerizing)